MKRHWYLIAFAALISGCSTTGAGFPQPSVPTETVGSSFSVNGGLVQRAAVSLPPGDRASALKAEQYALTAAPAGEAVNWQGQKARGSVIAASPYQVGDQNCRQYTQRIVVDGREFVGRGAACRETDGNWVLLE